MATTLPLAALLAFAKPSFEMIVIAIFAASLPTAFFLWLRWWLGSQPTDNQDPDQAIAEQKKADEAHLAHHGHGHGPGHGHGGHDHHHHAHA